MPVEALRGCLECTHWQAFGDPRQNIHEYTDVITSYIHFCEELSVHLLAEWRSSQTISRGFHPVSEAKLKAKAEAVKSGDRASYKKAQYDVQRAIRGAKINYRRKLED